MIRRSLLPALAGTFLLLAPAVHAQSGAVLGDDRKAANPSSRSRNLEEAARRASSGDPSEVLKFFPLERKRDQLAAAALITRAAALVVARRPAEAAADCAEAEQQMMANRRELLNMALCSALGGAYADMGNGAARLRILRRLLQHHPREPFVLNELAWVLATETNAQLRNGQEAVKLAEAAGERTKWKDAQVLDTYAAALAEAGRWDDAIRRQMESIALVRGGKPTSGSEADKRLALYKSRRAFRENLGPVGNSRNFLRSQSFKFDRD